MYLNTSKVQIILRHGFISSLKIFSDVRVRFLYCILRLQYNISYGKSLLPKWTAYHNLHSGRIAQLDYLVFPSNMYHRLYFKSF